MNSTRLVMIFLVTMLLGPVSALAQQSTWPQTVSLEQGSVTLYEPQVDSMSDDELRFRSALAYRESPGAEPVFGAGWFRATVVTNRFSDTVHTVDLAVLETRFPSGTNDVQAQLAAALSGAAASGDFTFSLEQLESSLADNLAEQSAAGQLNTSPPKIVYRDHPALLVVMDGAPVMRDIENSPLQAVINTPYPLIHDGKRYWLNVAEGVWYEAAAATGPYRFSQRVPADVASVVRLDDEQALAESATLSAITAKDAPEIIVTTEPAELVVTDGPAAFVPLVDDLLVLQNSDDDVFMHVSGQHYYIVLSGRWYRAPTLSGPWAFHEADRLPAAFASIPLESEQADSRVYVAGTEEANDAVLDAQVPQTAAVARGPVEVEVEYDGAPSYAPVDGTDMQYVQNTGSTVILADGNYYLVEDGVWYVSSGPNGPWQVAVTRPSQVRVIRPTSPVYNTKFVYIYDYTPDVVYVGYTPGYTGSYVYHNTVFYGSGWYYRPWVTPRYYYPHHSTWGFHVSYNPWSGWGFGLSWGWGPFYVNYTNWHGGYWHHHHHWHSRYHHRYWGPHGYRPRHGHYAHRRPGYGGHPPHPRQRHHNLYRDRHQLAQVSRTRDLQPRGYNDYRDVRRQKNYSVVAAKSAAIKAGRTASYSKPQALSRESLAGKAAVRDASFRGKQQKALASKPARVKNFAGKSGGKSLKSSPGKLNRNTVASLDKLALRDQKATRLKASPGKSRTDVGQDRATRSRTKASAPVKRTQLKPVAPTRYAKPTRSRNESARVEPSPRTLPKQASRSGKVNPGLATNAPRQLPKSAVKRQSAPRPALQQPSGAKAPGVAYRPKAKASKPKASAPRAASTRAPNYKAPGKPAAGKKSYSGKGSALAAGDRAERKKR